jgi:hypothetical protein
MQPLDDVPEDHSLQNHSHTLVPETRFIPCLIGEYDVAQMKAVDGCHRLSVALQPRQISVAKLSHALGNLVMEIAVLPDLKIISLPFQAS